MFSPAILIVDDDPTFRRNLRRLCEQMSRDSNIPLRQIKEAETLDEAREAISSESPDVIFLDFMLPEKRGGGLSDCGFEILSHAKKQDENVEVIMMSAVRDDASSAVEALTQRGAFYFFVKERFDAEQLQRVLFQAVQKRHLAAQCRRLRCNPSYFVVGADSSSPLESLLGECAEMRKAKEMVMRVSQVETTVLILGESGTGKELVARAVHYHSRRNKGPFVPVNCAAVPEKLWESQFFGHVRGAFTGAEKDHLGYLGEAAGGTLFLDEVGEIPKDCQAKLLRAIEEGTFRPVGGKESRTQDVRIVAATKRSLGDLVEKGEFRDDLYYRLEKLVISMPPLADRGQDIVAVAKSLLNRHLLKQGKRDVTLHPDSYQVLLQYGWPGNVRELDNVMERCVLMLEDGDRITQVVLIENGPFRAAETERQMRQLSTSLKREIDDWKKCDDERRKKVVAAKIRETLIASMQESGGNVSHASVALGLSRGTFYKYLEMFDLHSD